jgi:hypothetical protein
LTSPTFLIETGNYEMKDGAKSLLDRGKYVVGDKRDGEWKLYRDRKYKYASHKIKIDITNNCKFSQKH